MSTENQFNPPQPTGASFWRKEETISDVTLRDYFAAKAMQSICHVAWEHEFTDDSVRPDVAQWAFKMADAMLAERGAK